MSHEPRSRLRLAWPPSGFLLLVAFLLLLSVIVNRNVDDMARFSAVLNHSDFNVFDFYTTGNPWFLDFNFNRVHPGSILLSLLSWIMPPLGLLILLASAILLILYYNFNDAGVMSPLVLIFLSGIVLFSVGGGIFGLVLLQYLVYRTLGSGSPGIKKFLVAFLSSMLYLPGFLIVALIGVSQEYPGRGSRTDLFRLARFYFLVAVLLIGFHLFLAWMFFGVSAAELSRYLFLPVISSLSKMEVNNLSRLVVLTGSLSEHGTAWLICFAVTVYAWFITERKKFVPGILISALVLLLIILLFPFSTGLWVMFHLLYFLDAVSRTLLAMPLRRPLWIVGSLLVILLPFMVRVGLNPRARVVVQGENIVISPKDMAVVDFDTKNIGTIHIIDLKIIPENARLLLEDTGSGKIEPIMNPYASAFLERELRYADGVMTELSGQAGQKSFQIYLSSRIHPGSERPPYRRVHLFWETFGKTDSRLVLF